MGLSAEKLKARLAIHNRMGEPCTYTADGDPTVPTAEHIAAGLTLTARFHSKMKTQIGNSDGLSIMEPVEKLVFLQSQLDLLAITLEQGAEVHFPRYGFSLVLDMPLDPDGPENVYWTATRA